MKKINDTLRQIISILNDCQFHDGNTIGEQLGISRTAVWKAIKKLEDYGVNIIALKNKGYCLEEPLFLLNDKTIKKRLQHKPITLDVFESIDSTNQYLKTHKSDSTIQVCIAEAQTQGRGRLNRSWLSPFGKNIYLSLTYKFKKDISALKGLSIITSLAIQETLAELPLPIKPMIKWPNDIYYQDEKISGSLIEIQAESNGYSCAIIGVGINVNMQTANQNDLNQPWTSLQLILGKPIDRNILCANLINNLIDTLIQFENKGDQHFINAWRQCDYLKDHTISFMAFDKKIKGIARGVDHNGHLLIEDKHGKITSYSSGDARLLRKV